MMHDPHVSLADYAHVKVKQMIVILVNRSGQSIFNGDDRVVDLAAAQSTENLLEFRKRHDFDFVTEKLAHGFLAESSESALKSRSQPLHAGHFLEIANPRLYVK